MRLPLGLVPIVILSSGLALSAAAQQPRERAGFGAAATVETTTFADGQSAWQVAGLRIVTTPRWGSLGLEGRSSERFGRREGLAGLDAWVDAFPGWFANLRVVAAPGAEVHPSADALLEVFVPAGRGWEPSASVRVMRWPGTDVRIGAAALGRYAGAWFLRGQAILADAGRGGEGSLVASARRYMREPDRYLEGRLMAGREVIPVGGEGRLETAATRAAVLRVLWGLGGGLDLGVSGAVQDDRALGRRVTISVELAARL